jgi:hypothetical protein
MAYTHAMVHELTTFTLGIPSLDISRANLKLKRRRYTVAHHHPVRILILTMLMQVDEAGNHDKPRSLDHSVTLKRYLGDRSYLTSNHSNRAYGVEARFWIDDPAPLNHQIVMGIPNVTTR